MHADLPDLVQEVAALGYAIKLDTTGLFPDLLRTVLAIPAVDYVAMDVKTLPAYYDRVGAAPVSTAGTIGATTVGALLRSMSILRAWRDEAGEGIDHRLEFRTTCAPGIVSTEELAAIPALLSVGDRWVLNQFRPGNCLDPSWNTVPPYPPDVLLAVADSARSEGIDAHVRGV